MSERMIQSILETAQAPIRRDVEELPQTRNILLVFLLGLFAAACNDVEAQEPDEHCWSPGWNQPEVCMPSAQATAEAREFQREGKPSGVSMSAGLMNPHDHNYPDPYVLISWDTPPSSTMWVAIDFEKADGYNARIYGNGTDVFRYDRPNVRGNGWIWLPNEGPALRDVGCEVGENFIRLTLTCMNSYTPLKRQYIFERNFLGQGQTYTAQIINVRSKGAYSDFYSPQVRATIPWTSQISTRTPYPTATPVPRPTRTPYPTAVPNRDRASLESQVAELQARVDLLERKLADMERYLGVTWRD